MLVEHEIRKHQGTHAIRRLAVHEYRTIQRVANELAEYIELPITERLVADGQREVTEPGASDLAHLIVSSWLTRLAEIDDGFEARPREHAPRSGIRLAGRRDSASGQPPYGRI